MAKNQGVLSKTFGAIVGAYFLVGTCTGIYAELEGSNNGNNFGADFGRGFVYGSKQLTYFGLEAGKVIGGAAYDVGAAGYDAVFD